MTREKNMLILASASPRRQELLRQIGCEFRVFVSRAEELSASGVPPEKLATENARRKAEEAASRDTTGLPVLGADTVVAVDAAILGKPKDEEDAAKMLRLLSGRKHFVYTGVAILDSEEKIIFAEKSEVTFFDITDEKIQQYIETGEPMDKAGAYGIQDNANFPIVKSYIGSYSNIVGFPLEKIKKELENIKK